MNEPNSEGHQRRRDDEPAHAEKATDAAGALSGERRTVLTGRAKARSPKTTGGTKKCQQISSREEIPSHEVGACPIMRGAEGDRSAGSGPSVVVAVPDLSQEDHFLARTIRGIAYVEDVEPVAAKVTLEPLRSRKRKVEVDRMISSPMAVDPSKVTRGSATSVTVHDTTAVRPSGMATRDGARSQVSQSRTSDRRSRRATHRRDADMSDSAQGGVPVLVRDENLRHVPRHYDKVGGSLEADEGGGVAVDPRQSSAFGLARATSREAPAGSTPVTENPSSASRTASEPVPQPTSTTR